MYSPPTSTEHQQFMVRYESFSAFLLEFLDVYEDGVTLQNILDRWLNSDRSQYDWRRDIIKEARSFMQQIELPWTLIVDTSNRYFETKEAAYAWLTDALNQIEATLRS